MFTDMALSDQLQELSTLGYLPWSEAFLVSQRASSLKRRST